MSEVLDEVLPKRITHIPANALPDLWPIIEPMVDTAIKHSRGEFTPQTVVDGILEGRYILIGFIDGKQLNSIGVLQVSVFPTGRRVMEILLASGEGLKDWVEQHDALEDFARQFGCEAFRIIGRKGLSRMLTEWKQTGIVMEKAINGQ